MIDRRGWIAALLGVALLATAGCARGAERDTPEWVVVLVRHAEKVDDSEDPPLSEAGLARAAALARHLADAEIERVLSSDYQRTRDTAGPLARHAGVAVELYDPRDLASVARRVIDAPGRYLIVGHSNTTPELVAALGGAAGPGIEDDEYDRLYVLTRRGDGAVTTTLLRY